MRTIQFLLLLAVGILMTAGYAAPGDAPQWRGGPERTGAVTGPAVLATWPKDGPPLLWKAPLPYSNSAGCVAVADGVAYVTLGHFVKGDAAKGEKDHLPATVYAFDALTGAPKWSHDLGDTLSGWLMPGGTPAIADGRVFVMYGPITPGVDGRMAQRTKTIKVCCLDAATGALQWEAEQPATTVNITMHGGPYGSPLVVDGVCLVQESNLVAYDAASGKVLWTSPLVDGAHASPTAWHAGNRTLVLCRSTYLLKDAQKLYPELTAVTPKDAPNIGGSGVYALDLKTGVPQWLVVLPGDMWNAAQPAVIGDTLLYVGEDRLVAVHLDLHAPTILWRTAAGVVQGMAHYGPSPAVADGFIYMPVPQKLLCLSLADGSVAATQPQEIRFNLFTSATVVNDRVCFVDADMGRNGNVYLLQAGKEMHIVSQFPLKGLTEYPSPTIAHGLMYLRCGDGIACYDLRAAGK